MLFPCEKCHGEGIILVSEWNDQYDRTHQSWDTCPECGGTGKIEEEPLEVKRRAHGARRFVWEDARCEQRGPPAEDYGDPDPTGQDP